MYRVLVLILLFSPQFGYAQANCDGLTKAQCRFVTIVRTCAFGNGYYIEKGQVTINGRIVGELNDVGEIVDESGRILTELSEIYKNHCRD